MQRLLPAENVYVMCHEKLELNSKLSGICKCLLIMFICISSANIRSSKTEEEIPIVEPEFFDTLLFTGNYKEFSRLLRIPDTELVKPGKKGEPAYPMCHKGMPLGDILLTEDELQSYTAKNFTAHPVRKWKDGIIPYAIATNSYTPVQRLALGRFIMEFNGKVTNVQLRYRRPFEKDYVFIFSANGCYSHLGFLGGAQAISLQSEGCLDQGIIQHEFIHAAGLLHEQNRLDRDSNIRILEENIPEDCLTAYQLKLPPVFPHFGPYDFYSVLHYPMQVHSSDKPAFEIIPDGVDKSKIGQKEFGVTDLDVRKIDELYAPP